MVEFYLSVMEKYRSGHNEPHSKCGVPTGTVGSNPTFSAIGKPERVILSGFYIAGKAPDFNSYRRLPSLS